MKKSTKKTQKLTARLLLIALPFIFAYCGSDETSSNFSYKIDGESQKVLTVSGMLESEIQYDHEGRALYLTAANGVTKMLSVAVSNWDFQSPPENGIIEDEYDATFDVEQTEENPLADCLALAGANAGVTLCDGGMVTYILESDYYTSVFDGSTDAVITITDCNPGNRTVSGSFSTKVQNMDGVELTITGSFKKVKYTVL